MRVSGGVRAGRQRETHIVGFAIDFIDRVAVVDGVLEGPSDRTAMSRFTKALEELAIGHIERGGEGGGGGGES